MDAKLRDAMRLQLRRNHTLHQAHEVALYRVECQVQGKPVVVPAMTMGGERLSLTSQVAKSLARHLRRCGFEARTVYQWQ